MVGMNSGSQEASTENGNNNFDNGANSKQGNGVVIARLYNNKNDRGEFVSLYLNKPDTPESKMYLNRPATSGGDRDPDWITEDSSVKIYRKISKNDKVYLQVKFYKNNKFDYSLRAISCQKKTDKSPDWICFEDSIFTAADAEKLYGDNSGSNR